MSFNLGFLVALVFTQALLAPSDQSLLGNIIFSSDEFNLKLTGVLSKGNPRNLICSPVSLQVALAMASVGAGDNSNSYNEIKTLLKYPNDKAKMLDSYSLLSESLTSSKSELTLANRIFIDEKFKVKKEYLYTTKKYFNSKSLQLDFHNNPDAARKKINKWVEGYTNYKIKDLIRKGDLTDSTQMVVINAIHFKSEWKHKFNKNFTKTFKFYVNDTTSKDVDMMNMADYLKYAYDKEMNSKILELPYKGEEFSMIVVLPVSRTGLNELQEALFSERFDLRSKFEDLRRLKKVAVFASLPRFNLTETYDLTNSLEQLGVHEIFSPKANFSNISPYRHLKVAKVIQKVYFSVNEEGAGADSGTSADFNTRSTVTDIEDFTADHPFMFFIVKRVPEPYYDRIAIFSGVYKI